MRRSPNDRWGFKIPVVAKTTGQFQFDDLLSVNVENPCDWVLHLNALRYQNGALPQGASQPTDNQTQSLAGSNSPGQGWKLKLFFGTADAGEQVVVDYYARGCTMQVHGSMIRMQISGTINASNSGLPPPILSGFISPRARVASVIPSPTFSTAIFTVAAGNSVIVPIADRAVAYRVIDPDLAVTTRNVRQADAGGVGIQLDFTGAGASPATQEAGNAAGYYPLNPSAQFITVFNSDVTNLVVSLQFLLDLG